MDQEFNDIDSAGRWQNLYIRFERSYSLWKFQGLQPAAVARSKEKTEKRLRYVDKSMHCACDM
ncbi:hypothetical protein JZ751_026069 [Albula glossodonta]|uniref:Uncharacterized protein n=1 Tax=Albula glossodonta TaxID=121402 RepID=A0A8T2NE59_9TELE|nr:hypothetical protein JZ751_026069 [Albula glossodonta]